MSPPFSAIGSSSSTNGQASSVNGGAAYHPALPNFADFPGLTALTQSISSQSRLALSAQTAAEATSLTTIHQPYFSQTQRISSSNSDLDKLERLKKEILEGQNPIYRAVPQPKFLESLYLGRILQVNSSVPTHPDQLAIDGKTSGSQSPYIGDSKNYSESTTSSRLDNIGQSRSSISSPPGLRAHKSEQAKLSASSQDVSRKTSNEILSLSKLGQHTQTEQTHSEKGFSNDYSSSGSAINSSSAGDPPYDPKESFRKPGDSLGVAEKHVLNSRDSRTFELMYGRTYDRGRDARDRNYDYRYDERPDSRDRRITSGIDLKDSRPLNSKPQDIIYSIDDRMESLNYSENLYNRTKEHKTSAPSNSGSQTKLSTTVNDAQSNSVTPLSPIKSEQGDDIPRPNSINRQVKEEESSHYSLINGVTQQTSFNKLPLKPLTASVTTLEERIGSRIAPALEDRIGNRVPLEERLSTPPTINSPRVSLQDRIGERPLEERIGTKPDITIEAKPSTSVDFTNSLPCGKATVSPSSASSVDTATVHGKIGSQPLVSDNSAARSDARYLQRLDTINNDFCSTSVQNPSRKSGNELRTSFDTYQDGRERRYPAISKPMTDNASGHYDRAAILDDRGRPTLDNREWRERSNQPPKSSFRHQEVFSEADAGRYGTRPWVSNERGYRPTEWELHPSPGSVDVDRGSNRYIDRRSIVLRTWDREEQGRLRPSPEIYPPSGRADSERYVSNYRDPRVRGPSPNPSLQRRPAFDDLRPPAKRPREDVGGYYEERDRRYSREYIATPPPTSTGSFYDSRGPYPPYHDHPREPILEYYDRRPQHEMGSPYATSRPGYPRPDVDRYGVPPRTA